LVFWVVSAPLLGGKRLTADFADAGDQGRGGAPDLLIFLASVFKEEEKKVRTVYVPPAENFGEGIFPALKKKRVPGLVVVAEKGGCYRLIYARKGSSRHSSDWTHSFQKGEKGGMMRGYSKKEKKKKSGAAGVIDFTGKTSKGGLSRIIRLHRW